MIDQSSTLASYNEYRLDQVVSEAYRKWRAERWDLRVIKYPKEALKVLWPHVLEH